MKAFQKVCQTPWAIQPEALRTILEVASRLGDRAAFEGIEAVAAQFGERLEGTRYVQMRDGVAILAIDGPIARGMNLFSFFSGGTSVELLAKDFTAAMSDPSVKAILLNINSPGGSVDGISELAGIIYAARKSGKKPIKSYISDTGTSGAYWLAAAAEEIVANKTALLGSIGVVTTYTDTRKKDEMIGIEKIEIVSSGAPNKRPDVTTDEGRAYVQGILDDIESVFVSDLAKFRGVSVDTVRSDYGQGGVRVGRKAVAAGLADRTGTFEGVLSDLIKGRNSPKAIAPHPGQEAKSMNLREKLRVLLASDDPKEEELEDEEETQEDEEVTEPPATPPANPPADPPATETDSEASEVTRLRAELDRQKAETKAQQEEIKAFQRRERVRAEEERKKADADLPNTIKVALTEGRNVPTPATVEAGTKVLLPLSSEQREAVLGWVKEARVVKIGALAFDQTLAPENMTAVSDDDKRRTEDHYQKTF